MLKLMDDCRFLLRGAILVKGFVILFERLPIWADQRETTVLLQAADRRLEKHFLFVSVNRGYY